MGFWFMGLKIKKKLNCKIEAVSKERILPRRNRKYCTKEREESEDQIIILLASLCNPLRVLCCKVLLRQPLITFLS